MKIVFLSDDFPPTSFGGAGISTFELARGMKKAGHEVIVITTCREKTDAGNIEYEGMTIHRIQSNYNPRWRAYVSVINIPVVREVAHLLMEIKPDVVHINNVHFYLSYHCFKIAKRHARVVVATMRDTMSITYGKLDTTRYLEHFDTRVTWRDYLMQAKKRWNPLLFFFIHRYLRYVDMIVAISKSLQEALERNGIKDVSVIYNGIDVTEWHVDADTVTHFKTKYALEHKKILLFGGRLSTPKGGAKVIEALAQIVNHEPSTVLLVAGTIDAYARSMQAYAKECGVEQNLVFTGWIDRNEIKIAYASADIVMMPSIYLDAFGRVNIEGMASHKPVIGTCYGGTPEVTLDSVTGYIVNPLHSKEIAEKTIDLLKNPERAKQFGVAGYERVRTQFNLEDKVEEYIEIYTSLTEVKHK